MPGLDACASCSCALGCPLAQICDFLSSLPDNAREWRVLLSYLQSLEQHPAAQKERERVASQAHEYGGAGSSFMDAVQQQQAQKGGAHRRAMRRLLEDVTLRAADKAALIAAEFDPVVHSGLVEDLKRLYVAITRAKANVSTRGGVWQLRRWLHSQCRWHSTDVHQYVALGLAGLLWVIACFRSTLLCCLIDGADGQRRDAHHSVSGMAGQARHSMPCVG